MTVITFQIVSDLHIEFEKNSLRCITPKSPILCLLGDICSIAYHNSDYKRMIEFLDYYTTKFKHILWVPGNHEFYAKIDKLRILQLMKNIGKLYKNVHVLHNTKLTLPLKIFNPSLTSNVVILGTTLWTYIPKELHSTIPDLISDYSNIHNNKKHITCNVVNNWHKAAVEFLTKNIASTTLPIIVMTHHKPFIGMDHNKSSDRNVCYEVDMTKMFSKKIKLWAYGHTHRAFDKVIQSVHVYSNPRGYPSQKTGYDKSKIVHVKI
jgi:hypothetical protein